MFEADNRLRVPLRQSYLSSLAATVVVLGCSPGLLAGVSSCLLVFARPTYGSRLALLLTGAMLLFGATAYVALAAAAIAYGLGAWFGGWSRRVRLGLLALILTTAASFWALYRLVWT